MLLRYAPRSRWTRGLLPAGLLGAALCGGCATVAGGQDAAQNDPFEPVNRKVFAVNQAVDRAVIKPVAEGYRAALPEAVRNCVRAFIDNLHEPLIFANDLLQGRGQAAGITGRRFLINSTLGVAGLFDRATEMGEPRQTGDFGQTLYAWGVDDGPYLMLPFFGPSTVRDVVGLGVDIYASPIGHVGSEATQRKTSFAIGVSDGIDLRSRNIESLDSIEANSLDFYAYLRSVWRQNRQAALQQAREGAAPADDLDDPGASRPVPPLQ